MSRFDLLNSLSTGLLSALPPGLRLFWAHIVARSRGDDERARAFLGLHNRLKEIEGTLARKFGEITARFHTDIEKRYLGALSALLFEPGSPNDVTQQKGDYGSAITRPRTRLFKRPMDRRGSATKTETADGVEELYDYFFSCAKVQETEDLIALVARESVQQAIDLPLHTEDQLKSRDDREIFPKPGQDDGAHTEAELGDKIHPEAELSDYADPESDPDDAERRRLAYDAFATTVAPVLHWLARDGNADKADAIDRIRRAADYSFGTVASPAELQLLGGLVGAITERSRKRVLATAESAIEQVDRMIERIGPQSLAVSILTTRLAKIDENFGRPYRREFKFQRRFYDHWGKVRSDLDRRSFFRHLEPMRVVSLSADVARNELRRELIAGSVQCFISPSGEKHIRNSTGDASGPPPYFRSWIPAPTEPKHRR